MSQLHQPDLSDLVAAADIARRLNVRTSTVAMWKSRSAVTHFIEPVAVIANRPLWHWPDVEAWARRTNRLAKEEGHLYDAQGYDVTDQHQPRET